MFGSGREFGDLFEQHGATNWNGSTHLGRSLRRLKTLLTSSELRGIRLRGIRLRRPCIVFAGRRSLS